jgi:nucleoside-diphosphate-sugar epimerase
MRFPVTGAAGFIGSAVRPPFVGKFGATVRNVDKLTDAADIASQDDCGSPAVSFSLRRYAQPLCNPRVRHR